MSLLRRCILYVPGSNRRMLLKSGTVKVDSIVYDLEDSVPEDKKPEARGNVVNLLNDNPHPSAEQLVRVNDLSTGFAEDDVQAVLQTDSLAGIVLPKVESGEHIAHVGNLINKASTTHKHTGPARKILACIESPKAIVNLREICEAGSKGGWLDGLIFAAEDYAASSGVVRTPSLVEYLYARQSMATYARAYAMSAIDLVCIALRRRGAQPTEKATEGADVLQSECLQGREFGFTGKQAIHPDQVDTIQEIFGPNMERVAWARRVMRASEEKGAEGIGAFMVDGKVVDMPVIREARRVLDEARRAGL